MTSLSFSDILRYWPVIAFMGIALLGYGELRYQVKQNDQALKTLLDRDAETIAEMNQNSAIATLVVEIAKLKQKTKNISAEGWEEWGYVKRTVMKLDREVPLIERRVDKLETRTHAHWEPNVQ